MNWRVQSTPFVDLDEIYGRDSEREYLVGRLKLALLQAGDQTNNLEIHSIVGVGGVGKTTLGQLLYKDSRVTEYFELKIWISVSDPFDEVRVAKNIIENVKGTPTDSNQLGFLLEGVKECISGKRFLLVMDDVWTENESKWKPLMPSLKYGSFGSKILVTTRSGRVARRMCSHEDRIHYLRVLSQEACWLVLQRTALSEKDEGEWKRFEDVGRNIANKCKGLPLAAKALGGLLKFKNSLADWENVLNSEIWQLEEAEQEIFPHLQLSYNELSPTLKHCFSYCAVFPKDTWIYVEELIEHWMAVGYLGSDGSGSGVMELRGREYFDKLAMRSLFQDFLKDEFDGPIRYCKMHDIVHDFALMVRKDRDNDAGIQRRSTCNVCSPAVISIAKKYRSFGDREPQLSLCDCVTNIRAANLKREFDDQMIPLKIEKFIHLRRLDLSGNEVESKDMKTICQLYNLQTLFLNQCNLKELPREIRNLIHLRHLNLSENRSLEELPESLCELHELQKLNIDKCRGICRLPQGLHRLKNLKHLHNKSTFSLKQLPQGIAQLSGLCTLSEFRAGSGMGKLGWLKDLNRLSGYLLLDVNLSGSEVNIVEDAREGELKKKDGIRELDIDFDDMLDGDDWDWVNLLDSLEPHPNLLRLEISEYKGSTLPSWMVLPAVNKLKSICLSGFSRLSSFPPLGRLPFLEEIMIESNEKMDVLGQEFLGTTTEGSNSIAFPKLKRLTFTLCYNWREWEDITTNEEDSCEAVSSSVMPCLMELEISHCKRLMALPHRLLASSSLEKLNISGSNRLAIRYGERQGSAWKSISDVCPHLELTSSLCFDSIRHDSHVKLPEIYDPEFTVKRDDIVGRMITVDQTNGLQILSIVGAGIREEETLARLVYNDSRVSECFQLRIWVDVSMYQVAEVAKAIIASVTKKIPDYDQLEDLLESLKDSISGKKFLVVMYSTWMGESSMLGPVIASLKNGSIGSKVLVTAREESIAKEMGSLENEIYTI